MSILRERLNIVLNSTGDLHLKLKIEALSKVTHLASLHTFFMNLLVMLLAGLALQG
jgi:hypothetical protein